MTEPGAGMIASKRTVDQLFRSRTAFPTDLSIGELFDRDLIVESRFGRVGTDESLSARDVATLLDKGNVLLLGEPGSGKSVATLEVLRSMSSGMLAADLSSIDAQPAGARSSHPPGSGHRGTAILVDGVDEYISRGMAPEAVFDALLELGDVGALLVACRNTEYLRLLASHMPRDFFQAILTVKPWRVDVEFESYVSRLVDAALLDSPTIVQRVRESRALSELVSRPLQARMLTFLAGEDDLPKDDVALYGEYFSHLATVVDQRSYGVTPPSVTAAHIWKQACWAEYQTQGRGSVRFSVRGLVDHARGIESSADLVRRKLSAILNVHTHEDDASFIHYSFFEYLVASRFVETLTSSSKTSGSSLARSFQVDFTISVRRFVVTLVNRSRMQPTEIRRRLLSVYRAAGRLRPLHRLTVRNLAMYILCRVDGVRSSEIAALLESEAEPFLRNSIWWALARSGHVESADEYVQELELSPELSDSNRGYLLYYYGDISASADPPFSDSPPYADWSNTRRALIEKYESDGYQRVTPARRAVDMYTYLDLARVRGDQLEPEEIRMLQRMLNELRAILPGRAATEVVSTMTAAYFGVEASSDRP